MAKGSSTIDATSASIESLAGSVNVLNDRIQGVLPGYNKISSANEKALKATIDYQKAVKEKSKNLKNLHGIMKAATDDVKMIKESEAKLTKELSGQNKVLAQTISGFKQITTAAKGFAQSAAGLGAIVGVGAFSFSSIYKAALQYNQSLDALAMAHRSVGGDTADYNAKLQDLTKNLTMTRGEFADFSTQFMQLTLNAKPTIEDAGNLAKVLQDQLGPSVESQKKGLEELMNIQSKSPQVYDALTKAMEKAADATRRGETIDPAEMAKSQENIRGLGRAYGFTRQEVEKFIVGTNQVTPQQQKIRDDMAAAEKVQKEYKETMVELGRAALPVFKKMSEIAQYFLKVIQDYPTAIMSVFGAFTGLMALKPFLPLGAGLVSLVKATGGAGKQVFALGKEMKGLGTIAKGTGGILGAALGGFAVGTILEKQFNLSEKIGLKKIASMATKWRLAFAKESANKQMKQNTGGVDIDELSKRKQIAEEKRKGIKSSSEAAGETKKETDAVGSLQRSYTEVKVEAEARLAILKAITESYGAQIEAAEQMGMIDKEALESKLKSLKAEYEKTKQVTEAASMKSESEFGIKVDVNFQGLEKAKAIQQELLKLSQEQTIDSDKRKIIEGHIQDLNEGIAKQQKTGVAIANASYDITGAEAKQMKDITSKYEARLNAERQLMESAQFGLGASVEMMQKQVDLAQQNLKISKQRDEDNAKARINAGDITAEEMKQLQSMKSQKDAEDYITKTLGKKGDVAKDLARYAYEHQDALTEQLQQQQKIYDLTKDVREGYLDAVREMATGAGEFSKIIGTQDKGVTQLMKKVAEVTGENRLNTMALGGTTMRGAKSGRREVAGKFTTGGLEFMGAGQQEQRNKDIYRYGKQYPAGTTVGNVAAMTPQVQAAMRSGDKGTGAGRSYGDAINAGMGNFRQDSQKIDVAGVQKLSQEQMAAAQVTKAASGVQPIAPGTPYDTGKGTVRVEITMKTTPEASKYFENVKEIVDAMVV